MQLGWTEITHPDTCWGIKDDHCQGPVLVNILVPSPRPTCSCKSTLSQCISSQSHLSYNGWAYRKLNIKIRRNKARTTRNFKTWKRLEATGQKSTSHHPRQSVLEVPHNCEECSQSTSCHSPASVNVLFFGERRSDVTCKEELFFSLSDPDIAC
jgi:hypothetical protein